MRRDRGDPLRATVLDFAAHALSNESFLGRVHLDGSITFRGTRYPTIKQVPPECRAFRAATDVQAEWRRLYRVFAAKRAT